MKRVLYFSFTILLLTGLFTPSRAQIKRGALLLGGNLGISFGTRQVQRPINSSTIQVTESRTTTVIANPKVGYLFTSALALGVDLESSSTVYKDKQDNTKSTSSLLAIGPFVRYYFPQKLFIEGKLGFGNGENHEGYSKLRVFQYAAGLGYAAFLNDHVAVEPMLRYRNTQFIRSDNNDYRTKSGQFELLLGLQIYL